MIEVIKKGYWEKLTNRKLPKTLPEFMIEYLENKERRKQMNTVVIEQHNENGVEWIVSFTSSNPEGKDCVVMKNKEEAYKLQSLLAR